MVILIVDPEPCVRDVARKALRYAGFQAIAVAAPHEALLFGHSDPTVELLLTELTFAEMPGTELARQFLAISPSTALMFMSGYTEQGATGLLPLLEKPFTADVLIRRVEDALGSAAKIRRFSCLARSDRSSCLKRISGSNGRVKPILPPSPG